MKGWTGAFFLVLLLYLLIKGVLLKYVGFAGIGPAKTGGLNQSSNTNQANQPVDTTTGPVAVPQSQALPLNSVIEPTTNMTMSPPTSAPTALPPSPFGNGL